MHLEALTEEGKEFFPKLIALKDKGFYLAGGTALALQIGHRLSRDFDCFSSKRIESTSLKLIENITGEKLIVPLVNNADELTVIIKNTKISMIHYPFSPLESLVPTNAISLLSVPEIAATKAYAIGRRGSYRDYVDIYAVLKRGFISLKGIISLAERKYGEHFNGRLFLEQLLYWDDIADDAITYLTEPVSRQEVATYLGEAVSSFIID